jgi:hypothetical protein
MLAAVVALMAAPAGLAAQTIDSPYRFVERKKDVGPYVGYIFADAGQVDLGANDGPVFGMQFALSVSDPIQVSANVGYFPTTRDVIDPTAEGGPQSVGTEPFNLLLLSGRLQFNLTGARSWNRLVPYLIGGIGVAIDVSSDINCVVDRDRPTCQIQAPDRFDFGTSFMGQVGIGTAIIISKSIGARITFEDDIWRLTRPDGWVFSAPNIVPFPPDTDWTNNWQLSFIATYRF